MVRPIRWMSSPVSPAVTVGNAWFCSWGMGRRGFCKAILIIWQHLLLFWHYFQKLLLPRALKSRCAFSW